MYSSYMLINKNPKLNRYFMPIFKEIFDKIKYPKIFNTLDLRSRYYQLLVGEENTHQIKYLRINKFGKERLY